MYGQEEWVAGASKPTLISGGDGTARFFYEGGILGSLKDVGEYTGKHCISDWGIGVLAMRIEIKALSDNIIAKVADQFDN